MGVQGEEGRPKGNIRRKEVSVDGMSGMHRGGRLCDRPAYRLLGVDASG